MSDDFSFKFNLSLAEAMELEDALQGAVTRNLSLQCSVIALKLEPEEEAARLASLEQARLSTEKLKAKVFQGRLCLTALGRKYG